MAGPARQNPLKEIIFPILAGLGCAQVLGTLFVHRSNLALLAKIKTLAAAGWLAIPTGPAAAPLAAMRPALLGGLFYALSAGAGLSLLTWALLFLRTRVFGGHRYVLYAFLILWAGLLFMVNINGPSLYPSLFVVLVPLATALFMSDTAPSLVGPKRRKPNWLPFVVLVLLTGLWSTQLNKDLFIAIRDHVLLSNPVGRSVNDFYYRNTLYAAEAFKSFDQKTLKTCDLHAVPDDGSQASLRKMLSRRDILAVANTSAADVRLSRSDNRLVLASPCGEKLTVDPSDFYKQPGAWLKAYSRKTDRNGRFRRLILAGLLVGFPCLLYVFVYSVVRAATGLFLQDSRATLAAALLCLAIGVGLFIPMLQGRSRQVAPDRLEAALKAADWPQRVAALRYIETHKKEIADYPHYRHLRQSPLAVERYWLARALAVSRNPATYNDLLGLMEDPHPNVICQAYYALGERGDPAAIAAIREKMSGSDHWYTQWYAYRAMRRLGWQQAPSAPTP